MFEKQLAISEQKQIENRSGVEDQRNRLDKETDYGEGEEDDCIFPPIVSRTMKNKSAKSNKNSQIMDTDYQGRLPKIQIKIQLQENVNVHEYSNIPEKATQESEIVQFKPPVHQQFASKQQQDLPTNSEVQLSSHSKKLLQVALQKVNRFHEQLKSPTILFQDTDHTIVFQSKLYYQNNKLALTQPIKSLNSECKFRIENIKYCVGFGICLQQVIAKHEYNYQSQGDQQLSHGLYIITSQGYSWSHSQKQQDDILRQGFNQMYTGLTILVQILGQEIKFSSKIGSFTLSLPSRIRDKYTVCFCAYLHEKEDSISIVD